MLGKKNADTKMSTLIGAGAELTGDFTLDGSARIDGKIGGNVTVTGNLILGAGSIVTGDVQAASVLIGGEETGNITAPEKAELTASAKVLGDIATKVIVIDEHAVFQGKIDMNQTVPDRKGKARTAKAVRAGRKSAKAAIAEALKEVEEEEKRENDVKRVEDTWWYLLINEHGYQMERNNSYSGSTVCHTGYEKADYSDRSFVTRMDNLGNPDVLLVFGGTNDSWAKAPIGSYQYADWTKADLYSFRPAFCRLMDYLTKRYPDTRIYNITNTELSEDVINSMDEICRHYGVTNIRLRDIDKQWGHPSIKGMKSICEQVWDKIGKQD